jgi:hypothetical protein
MQNQQDRDMPTRSSNMEKAEGDRKSEWGEGTSEGAGISNRPMDEEIGNQESLPERGERKPGANAD